jgi:RimJ/RimL family protein N-acetyltransferase
MKWTATRFVESVSSYDPRAARIAARNVRAIRAYEAVGFRRIEPGDEQAAGWGPLDYYDSLCLVKFVASS